MKSVNPRMRIVNAGARRKPAINNPGCPPERTGHSPKGRTGESRLAPPTPAPMHLLLACLATSGASRPRPAWPGAPRPRALPPSARAGPVQVNSHSTQFHFPPHRSLRFFFFVLHPSLYPRSFGGGRVTNAMMVMICSSCSSSRSSSSRPPFMISPAAAAAFLQTSGTAGAGAEGGGA